MASPESRRTLVIDGDVAEATLPGIGKRYDMRTSDRASLAVMIHHSGRRDLYVLNGADEPLASVTLTDGKLEPSGRSWPVPTSNPQSWRRSKRSSADS